MRRPKPSDGPIPEEKLIAWSKQPYGVGFEEVRKLASELLAARKLLEDIKYGSTSD